MPSIAQRSFAGGEVAPALHARTDQTKVATGLATCRNFTINRSGKLDNRAGTELVGEVAQSAVGAMAYKFVFNADQTYLLEFGDQYLRIWRNRALQVPTGAVWDATKAYAVGDIADDGTGTLWYCTTANSNSAPDVNNTYWYRFSTVGGAQVYEIPTPYAFADCSTLQFAQSADIVTITHNNYATSELRRYGHTTWTLTPASFGPGITPPTNIHAAGTAGSKTYSWTVTAVQEDTYFESTVGTADVTGAGAGATLAVTSIASASGALVTLSTAPTAHQLVTGNEVRLAGFGYSSSALARGWSSPYYPAGGLGALQRLNGSTYIVDVIDANTFSLRNTTGYDTSHYNGRGTIQRANVQVGSIADPSTSTPVTITWNAVAGAREYNVYREKNGFQCYIGTTKALTFTDDGIQPDTSTTPPITRPLFETAGNYPACIGYFQQRLLLANTLNSPEKVWASRVGDYHNFAVANATDVDGSFSFTPNGLEVQSIRHMIDLGKLFLLTAGGEWVVQGDGDGVLKPTAPNLRQVGYSGSSTLRPIIVGSTALYVQARGTQVSYIKYDVNTDGYPANDLTIYSQHLFDGYTIEAWDAARIPQSIVWTVRSDGAMLGLTYVEQHEIAGWHRHDTGADAGDAFESIVTIPEGAEDAVYTVVRRTVGGQTKRYIERFASRFVSNLATDACFLDCSKLFDGTNTNPNLTMTLSGGSAWDGSEVLTLTAADVVNGGSLLFGTSWLPGDEIRLTVSGVTVKARITAVTNANVASVVVDQSVPVSLRGSGTAAWAWARAHLDCSWLAGRTVGFLLDGAPSPQQTASSNVILPVPAVIVRAGLPILAEVETLDIDPAGTPEPLTNKQKRITDITVLVEASRNMDLGIDADDLVQWRQRSDDPEDTDAVYTGAVTIPVTTTWNRRGRLTIRQPDPLPLSILAIVPAVQVGG
jgi:hypothetical protein